MKRSPKIMISACELSADNYAGNLVKALLKNLKLLKRPKNKN